MFNLIIAIVAIALIVATVAVTMYHGGNTENGTDMAKAAELLNESQQIVAAEVFYREANGVAPTSLADLTPQYLKSIPKGWTSVNGFVVSTEENEISDATCEAYNQKRGVVGVPACSDPAYAGVQVCCSAGEPELDPV
jgi:hypothetical protein